MTALPTRLPIFDNLATLGQSAMSSPICTERSELPSRKRTLTAGHGEVVDRHGHIIPLPVRQRLEFRGLAAGSSSCSWATAFIIQESKVPSVEKRFEIDWIKSGSDVAQFQHVLSSLSALSQAAFSSEALSPPCRPSTSSQARSELPRPVWSGRFR